MEDFLIDYFTQPDDLVPEILGALLGIGNSSTPSNSWTVNLFHFTSNSGNGGDTSFKTVTNSSASSTSDGDMAKSTSSYSASANVSLGLSGLTFTTNFESSDNFVATQYDHYESQQEFIEGSETVILDELFTDSKYTITADSRVKS